jgi:hypothetical protein
MFAGLCLSATAASAETPISVGPFNSVQLRGGGHVILHQGPTQRVTLLKGSTQFTKFKLEGNQLIINACDGDCPHRYELEIEIISPRLEGLAVKGGGKIEATGTFAQQGKLGAAVSGGGTIDARAIAAEEVDAAVTGGGEAHVKPLRTLNAAVTGGGNVAYSGNPHVTQAVVGGGSVTRE